MITDELVKGVISRAILVEVFLIVKHFKELEKMGVEWVDPWEKPLHNLYKNYPCLSPIPSLAIHCANINSVFGVSPLCDIKNLWDENEN